jgi:predicted RNA binding protein YcfA (HicA-like mRNA interferase family)
VPPKIRELIAELEQAGFENRGGKGNHRNYVLPRTSIRVTISGKLGDDAKPYQVRAVSLAIAEAKKSNPAHATRRLWNGRKKINAMWAAHRV